MSDWMPDFREFLGQERVKEQLSVLMSSARRRGQSVPHILLSGPAGTGKTTLARLISQNMAAELIIIHAATVVKAKDLAAPISALNEGDVLFIDEVHRLPPAAEELLYPVMQDRELQVLVDDGGAAQAIVIPLPAFTVIGATTKPGMMTEPFRDRFGLHLDIPAYTYAEMAEILRAHGSAEHPELEIEKDALEELSLATRRTPRVARRLLDRVADFAGSLKLAVVTVETVREALALYDIDRNGLRQGDRAYLAYLRDRGAGRPVGLSTIAAGLHEDPKAIEDIVEPHLMRLGLVEKTPRGRRLTDDGAVYLDTANGTHDVES